MQPEPLKRFPVLPSQGGRAEREMRERMNCPTSVPWAMLAPHEAQALSNHDQTLRRLAERGGLSPMEMICILEDRRWEPWEPAWAITKLKELVAAWCDAHPEDYDPQY